MIKSSLNFISKLVLISVLVSLWHFVYADKEFVIAYSSVPTTLDPHKSRISVNVAIALHRFETLFNITSDSKVSSSLLEKWESIDDLTWVFELKKDIKFQDGSILTTKDIIYSIDRIKSMKDSNYNSLVVRWKNYAAIDDYHFKITTQEANANLLHDLGFIFIIKSQPEPISSNVFYSIQGNIGTGPYILQQYSKEGDIVLNANPYYHGSAVWAKVVRITSMIDPMARLVALQQGKVQLAEGLTEIDSKKVLTTHNFNLIRLPTHRLIHLVLDTGRPQTPFAYSIDNERLETNPLKQLKVRKAMSLAIDRNYLVSHVLKYTGTPAEQYVLPNVLGYIGGLTPDAYNPVEAKQLLAEAGYPDGFKITLHGTNNRYFKDQVILEAIAEMLINIGIKVNVVSLESKEFFLRADEYQYSLAMLGVSSEGNLQLMLESMIHTFSKERGVFNIGHYSNITIDYLIQQAGKQFNEIKRIRQLKQATEMALQDYAVIPLYFEVAVWGINYDSALDFIPSRSGFTLAQDISPINVH